MVCILGLYDCGSKSESKSTIDLETLNKSVSNLLSQKAASAGASAVNINDMTVYIQKMGNGCDIDASQHINSKVKALSSIDSVSTVDLQNTIKSSANSQIDQAAQSKSGFFATAPSDSKTVQDYKNKVSNIIETNITDQQKSDAFASVFNKNKNQINIGECGGNGVTSTKLNASQNIVSDLVAQAIVKSISSQLQSLDTTSSTTTQTSQSSTSKSGGLEDVIASIFDGLTGLYIPIIIGCLLCCLCCVALIFFGASGMASGGGGGGNVGMVGGNVGMVGGNVGMGGGGNTGVPLNVS